MDRAEEHYLPSKCSHCSQRHFCNEQLISAIREKPPLWNDNSDGYYNPVGRRKLWETVAEEIGVEVVILKKKWGSLRGAFRREYAKMVRGKIGNQVCRKSTSKWEHFESMLFLGKPQQKKVGISTYKNQPAWLKSKKKEPAPSQSTVLSSLTDISQASTSQDIPRPEITTSYTVTVTDQCRNNTVKIISTPSAGNVGEGEVGDVCKKDKVKQKMSQVLKDEELEKILSYMLMPPPLALRSSNLSDQSCTNEAQNLPTDNPVSPAPISSLLQAPEEQNIQRLSQYFSSFTGN